MDNKVRTFAERALSIRCVAKADMDTLRQQMIEADLDPSAVLRLASWLEKDEAKRAEQDAIDDQYRFLAGVLPEPAELPEESQIAKAAALYADKLSVRAVAKEMGVSVGRAHKLKVLAAAFTVHERVNVNTPAHDPDTGEIVENGDRKPQGDDTRTPEPSRSAEVVATPCREMTEDDLGDPLLVIDRDRARFREKVRRVAASVKPQEAHGPTISDDDAWAAADAAGAEFLAAKRARGLAA